MKAKPLRALLWAPLLSLGVLFGSPWALPCAHAAASGAAQQPSARGNIDRFRASTDPRGLWTLEGTATSSPGYMSAGTVLRLSHHPLVWRYDDGSYDPVVDSHIAMDVWAHVGIIALGDLGVALPVVLHQDGPETPELGGSLRYRGVGDLRIVPRLNLFPERIFGIGLSVIPEISLPTGARDGLNGDGSAELRPRIVASAPAGGEVDLQFGLGYRLRRNHRLLSTALGDEVELLAGAQLPVRVHGIPARILAELRAVTAAATPFSKGDVTSAELTGGVRSVVAANVELGLGVAVGLTRGLGTPAYRLLASLAYVPEQLDTDHDGVPDAIDACPEDPEDYDMYADLDGCPEEDGSMPVGPAAPHVATALALPTFDPDPDHDGLPSDRDYCPDDAEDIDAFQDGDGCPEPDNDRDGVMDTLDTCPMWPETINGIDDDDGCPDEGVGSTTITRTSIEIRETILFETGKAIIKPVSRTVLDQVAAQLRAHTEILLLRIEGHTDNVGDAEQNRVLSQLRANAVRDYLVAHDVAAGRLQPMGFGETSAIDSNATAEGRTHNRRVEFVVLDATP